LDPCLPPPPPPPHPPLDLDLDLRDAAVVRVPASSVAVGLVCYCNKQYFFVALGFFPDVAPCIELFVSVVAVASFCCYNKQYFFCCISLLRFVSYA
jgi:hypothetical protein